MKYLIVSIIVYIIISIIVLFLLSGSLLLAEPYTPIESIKTTLVTFESNPEIVNDVLRKYEKEKGMKQGEVVGMAELKDGTCTIYALEPKDLSDKESFRIIGHETLHCFKNQFHD